jgi:hypothetical protein
MKVSLFFERGVSSYDELSDSYIATTDDRIYVDFEMLPRRGDFICFSDGNHVCVESKTESFVVKEVTFYVENGISSIQITLAPEQ